MRAVQSKNFARTADSNHALDIYADRSVTTEEPRLHKPASTASNAYNAE
jgi:hypothetical protein